MTAREAMRTRAFWLISLGHSIALLAVSAIMVHLVALLTEGVLAFSLAAAGSVVAFLTGAQLAGLMVGTVIGDRYDKRLLCALCLAAHGLGLLALAFATQSWIAILGVGLHGIAWGIRGP